MLAEIRRIRKEDAADGTTARGVDCLYAALRWRNIPSAPVGTNCIYYCKQMLRELCALPEFRNYVLP